MIERQLESQLPKVNSGFIHNGVRLENLRISESAIITDATKLEIKDHVYISHYSLLETSNVIHIGEGVQISSFCSIYTHSSHHSIRLYGKEYVNNINLVGYLKGSVSIGDYTFIGSHTVIMPKTNIGKGCIVCAQSFCKGDYPDYSIIAGNPAVVIGDTRNIDQKYLNENEFLKDIYYENN